MIISRGRSYLFVHIPKTGGTSMALALEGRAMKDDVMIGDTPKAVKRRRRLKNVQTAGRLWKHSTLADIDGLIGVDKIADLFTFTLVRNPWDRTVSYYHWLREQTFDHASVRLAKTQDFEGFVSDPQTQQSLRQWPARRYMTDFNGTEQCRAYIRLEHLAEDAAPLWAHLGFELELPQSNASVRETDYRRYYSPATCEIVAECCAEDIARFGYVYD
ncbi:sulfotransferase family 2 domain-containing protein [Sulfitobacter mediterraneus]|uniref:sulfotransferase family 2 domain-containing protein n=1 Tax=Sulfitobacter mediterraneus TaxID=83219 RepID=UPI001933881C|nr:sulfotransferase family 2 domain-containing protein [Sulfitobacter mediterraneus]MBM1633764.1 sulfotransferase family 2 domain-containing protein [Sulfitobacter mediterraneus]MBM1641721.1 sulfotransferase family 2 domain-containing protein [Sulfitobacter mediterraneus]MBM1645628.1 sulfotransferase family 2 domain-containing protein [Sulfitobacter mediterraneus]MBM1649840.1 sulfotransferase family 2 domain-containing protein [Sulfitobacter mediterraneus]MBM1653697.1 sulfotransferase family 2